MIAVAPTISRESGVSTPSAVSPGWWVDAGLQPYRACWDLQRRVWAARVAGRIPDTVLAVQHPHTYTYGVRKQAADHVLWDPETREGKGVEVVQIDRGGDVTYHGPGQLVLYPILHVGERRMNLHRYLRSLEEVVIRTLAGFGVTAGREEAHTGVWVGDRKIAAIGIKVSKWVTMHGMAFNVSPDLGYFSGIVPCGIVGKGVTSLAVEWGRPVDWAEVSARVAREAGAVWGCAWEAMGVETLTERTA